MTSEYSPPPSSGAADGNTLYPLSLLAVGQETVPRELATSSTAVASQIVRLTYFVSRKAETYNTIAAETITAATVTSLARLGFYTVAGNGDLTLAAATVNDVTLYASASTRYTRSLNVPVTVAVGVRYALAELVIASTLTGTRRSTLTTVAPGNADLLAADIRAAIVNGVQADLPATVTAANVVLLATGAAEYLELLP